MLQNRSAISFYSGDKIDQIIGVHEGSISVGAPSKTQGSLSASDTFGHPFNDSCYFEGIFSSDGGTTWNDFGAQTPYLGGSFPTFQTLDCNAVVTTADLIVKATSYYDIANNRSVAYTLQYKVLFIAKNQMAAPFTPISTNEKLSLFSGYNYQKIYVQDKVAIDAPGGESDTQVIVHGLDYKPKVRAWWFDGSDPTTCRPLVPDLSGIQLYLQPEVQVGENDLTFVVDGSATFIPTNGNIEYRIYYDS